VFEASSRDINTLLYSTHSITLKRPQPKAMRSFAIVSLLAAAATATCQDTPEVPNTVPSLWDGKCFYPTGDIGFQLEPYLGRWYQVAGTLAPFTAGCKCIFAEYELNVSRTCIPYASPAPTIRY
jgi:hypothetical protein